jgi:hypothetical protein
MLNKKHLASITILVKDRQTHAKDVQEILTKHGHLIMARLGINPQRSCVSSCTGFIVVAIEADAKEISAITKELNDLYGIVAESTIITKKL